MICWSIWMKFSRCQAAKAACHQVQSRWINFKARGEIEETSWWDNGKSIRMKFLEFYSMPSQPAYRQMQFRSWSAIKQYIFQSERRYTTNLGNIIIVHDHSAWKLRLSCCPRCHANNRSVTFQIWNLRIIWKLSK